MTTVTLSEVLDDLRAADQVLRKFEQRYWLSSDVFYELYGQNLEDFNEWAGFYKIKQHREELLSQFSKQRIAKLSAGVEDDQIRLTPEEPLIDVAA
jgi:hypothetical protein